MSPPSSSPTVSPSNSQEQVHIQQYQQSSNQVDIPLDTLVSYLLAAKRSLSSVNAVWRANEIVTAARSALEESAILNSRTGFLRKGISQQTSVLKRIREGVEAVYTDGQKEYEDVLQRLDVANSRLQDTMGILRDTIVEASFRPADEEPRSLLSFANDDGVETVRTTIKGLLDECQVAQTDFSTALESYRKELDSVRSAFGSSSDSSGPGFTNSPISTYLVELELNATEMASLLSSLVQHFDLCVTAIRETEGGITAVRDLATNDPSMPSLSGVIGSPSVSQLQPTKSPMERLEMYQVLANDAAQISDVLADVEERLSVMEEHAEAVNEHLSHLRQEYKNATIAFKRLDSVSAKLHLYMSTSQIYLSRWDNLKAELFQQENELEAMRAFYLGYASSYDGLILEVQRRSIAEEKMRSTLVQALEKVRKMHEADTQKRDAFRQEVGDFLPGDLWEGLRFNAVRYDVGLSDSMEKEGEEGMKSTPALDEALVRKAMERRIARDV